jgi:hypothetical protein
MMELRDGQPGSGLAVSRCVPLPALYCLSCTACLWYCPYRRSLGDLDFKEPARFAECDHDVTLPNCTAHCSLTPHVLLASYCLPVPPVLEVTG